MKCNSSANETIAVTLSKSIKIGFDHTNFEPLTSDLLEPLSSIATDCRNQYSCSDRENISLRVVNLNLTLFCNNFSSLA